MKRILFLALTMLILPAVYTAESQVVGKYMEKKLKQATQRAGQKADQEGSRVVCTLPTTTNPAC